MNFQYDKYKGKKTAMYAAATAVVLSVLVMVGSFLSSADRPDRFTVDKTRTDRTVTPLELAEWYVEGRRDFEVLDMRDQEKFEKGHIKNAISCPVCHQNKEQAMNSDQTMPHFGKKLVIYTQTGSENIELPRVLTREGKVYFLAGGYEAWQKKILEPGDNPDAIETDDPELRNKIFALSNYFLGKTEIEPPPVVEVKNEVKAGHFKRSFVNEGC